MIGRLIPFWIQFEYYKTIIRLPSFYKSKHKKQKMNFHNITVKEIKFVTSDTIVIYMDIPADLKEAFAFVPGQYVTISDDINGKEVRRSYSICSAPWEDTLAIGVKRVPGGALSTFMHSNYKSGMKIKVSPPEGKFKIAADEDVNNDYYFIAAGSGITPIMSMVTSIVELEPLSRCYLLYGSRDENSIIFKDKLDALSKKYEGQLEVTHSLSSPLKVKKKGLSGIFSGKKVNWTGETGRITKAKIEDFISKYPKLGNEAKYYLCGPGSLIDDAEKIILSKSIDKKAINREYFTSSVKSDATTLHKSVNGQTTVNVTLEGDTFSFGTDGKLSLLEEMINLKKNPPYSCTSGACSSCVAKVTSGKAEMEVCFALDDDEIEAGYILTCQARATTPEISIDFEQ